MFIYLLFSLFITLCGAEGDIDIKDAGIGNFTEDDIAMIFYVTLENKCDKDLEISVGMVQCCENTKPYENDCSSMFLIGGDMGILYSKYIKNVTLIYPNLYLTNRQGICTISIKYKDGNSAKHLTKDVAFRTTGGGEEQCDTLDLDPTQNCNPVDCVVKYSGGKSYFNPKCRECEVVPVCVSNPGKCLPEIFYSIASNNCTQLKEAVTKKDLEMLENNQVDANCGQCSSNTVCHHGNLDNNGQCECENDWITTTDDEVYEPSLFLYHMCNIEIGAWNSVNKGRIRTTALIIGIFALTIASKILILMCILNWCYKHFRTSKKIPTCSDKLDPFDESIILCEDLSNFDQCICDEPPKSRSKILHTETVNVSYYPCSPSIFSSIRYSTGSEKGKHSIKTEQSIILSKTTSSSVPVSFQSDTEASSETNEEVEDEENYEIEFSGEGEDDNGVYKGEYAEEDEKLREEEVADEGLVDEESEYSRKSNKGSVSSKSKSLSKSISSGESAK